MARYIKDFQIGVDPQTVHLSVNQYLQSEGYEHINYDGENVFKKGKGVLTNPSFFKFSYSGNVVRMETWMKFSFFPGVYVGELGLTGFVGSAMKGPWKRRINQVELILTNYTIQAQNQIQTTPLETESKSTNANFCTNCGAQISPGAESCASCGQITKVASTHPTEQQNPVLTQPNSLFVHNGVQLPPPGQPVSRKEFINNYAQPSLKNNIRSIAILCYICSGVSALFAILFAPLGIIDALILLGITLGMHLGKSKGCAIAILVVSIIEVLLSLASGSFPFWWLIAGISAVVTFSKIDKQFKQFKAAQMNQNTIQ